MAAARQRPAIGRACCRRDVERLYDAFENSRASRVDLPLLPPSDARAYCATVRDKALDSSRRAARRRRRGGVHLRAGGQPREPARRNDAAGAEPAVGSAAAGSRNAASPGRPGRGGHVGAGARRPVRPRRRRGRPSRTRWTTSGPRTSSTCPASASAGSRSPTANGSSSSTTAATGSRDGGRERGWDASRTGGLDGAAVLESGRHPHPVRPRRGHSRRRARAARHLLRGRGLRGVGRCAAAHRDRVGEGVRVGPESR